MDLTYKFAKPRYSICRLVCVFKKEDGEYKLHYDIFNSPA